MDKEQIEQYIMDMPDEVMSSLQFSVPWQYTDTEVTKKRDSDGFHEHSWREDDTVAQRDALQKECWWKFHRNPQINTSVRGLMGRMTGLGFETTSEIPEIQEVIEEIELDPRNRLYNYWPKFVGRANVEGELFLCLSLHDDGFVEVDFIDPAAVQGGDDNSGLIMHPSKPNMPLFYNICRDGAPVSQIPSIFVARYPELRSVAAKNKNFDLKLQTKHRTRKKKYRKIGGYTRFIVSWDKGLITRRAVSYLRTTIEWINYYENLKKYEIDHKKSAGSYLWVFRFTEPRAFKLWMSLSDEDRRKTGIAAKKVPGGSLVLPPGVEVECKNPQLTSIKEQDTDIKEMVASGLNEPDDVMTGSSRGTYASVKASRGPMSDRTSDEIAYFDRFLKYDFWNSVFFLRSSVADFPTEFMVREAVSFNNKQEPVFKTVKKRPEQLVDVSYPTSEVVDFEARAKGLLGVKHGPIAESLGIPNADIARRMGFGGYGRQRLRKATEDEKYPELIYEQGVDAESLQETVEGEPGKPKPKAKPKAEPKKDDTKRS